MLSEFVDDGLARSHFRSHRLENFTVADPFTGGSTPLVEANRLGADVVGWDINPMAWWIVERELDQLDTAAYRTAAQDLVDNLKEQVGRHFFTEMRRVRRGQSCQVLPVGQDAGVSGLWAGDRISFPGMSSPGTLGIPATSWS